MSRPHQPRTQSLTQSSEIDLRADNIYFNLNIVNNDEKAVALTTQQQLTGPIVDDPNSYYLTVARFTLDGSGVPLALIKDNYYYVSMTLGPAPYVSGVNYVAIPIIYPFPAQLTDVYPNAIFTYQDWADLFNKALKDAFAVASTFAGWPAGATAPPYLVWQPALATFAMYYQTAYDTDTGPIGVWFNNVAYFLFGTFPGAAFGGDGSPNKLDFKLRAASLYGTNTSALNPTIPAGYYKMEQEYSSPWRLTTISGIAFKSSTMGTRSEFITNPNVGTSLTPSNTAGTGIPASSIITDFVGGADTVAGLRSDIVYLPATQYRLIDILGNVNNKIDITVLLVDKQGKTYPFLLNAGAAATIKMLWVKKSLYKNFTSFTS